MVRATSKAAYLEHSEAGFEEQGQALLRILSTSPAGMTRRELYTKAKAMGMQDKNGNLIEYTSVSARVTGLLKRKQILEDGCKLNSTGRAANIIKAKGGVAA